MFTIALQIAFFAVSGIDVLDSLDLLSSDAKRDIIDWIYSLQVIPSNLNVSASVRSGGFQVCRETFTRLPAISWIRISSQGSTNLNILDLPEGCSTDAYKWGHLAMTYTSIAILAILGDDLSRLDRKAIIEGKQDSR